MQKPLRELAQLTTERAGNAKCILMSITSGVGLVSQMEKFGRTIAGKQLKNYFVLRANNFAYNKSATKEYPQGSIAMYSGAELAAVPNSIFTCFSVRADEVYPEYLHRLFLGNIHGRWLRKFISVGARAHGSLNVNDDDLLSLPVPLPVGRTSIKEQKKIADCLASIDSLIEAEARKVDALNAHKKGLIQYLFPIDAENQPRLRFAAFREKDGWKKQTVSSILEKVVNPVSVEINRLYRQIGIRSHGKGIFHKAAVNGKELGDKRVFWVEQDAFIVNIVFAWEQAVAITSASESGMIASHRFPMYRAKRGKCNVKYIMYFFLTRKGKQLLGLASPGGAGRNKTLGQKEFDGLGFFLPETVEEQTRIADCLASIDDLIAAHSKKLDALKLHRKGLMQQLFPFDEGR